MFQPFTADGDADAGIPESPRSPDTLHSITAFARFEFEAGKANEGTKILMVEWEDDDSSRDLSGTWQVSWDKKTTVLPADERTSDTTRRLYFLLPPGTSVPPHITLAYQLPPNSASTIKQSLKMTINPLPAIFPPELGATARASGKKGVLHTIWAKKRLQVLDKEIRREEEFNLEGIALEMALSEKEWIETNFGLGQKIPSIDIGLASKYPTGPLSPTLASPSTSGGSRLSEKLRGLSLGTSAKDLLRHLEAVNIPSHESHPLSPEGSDVAISSFNSFRNPPATNGPPIKRIVASSPPDYIKRQQAAAPMVSMDFVSQPENKDGGESELFAKAMSPRSPDIARSPFSFSNTETMPFSNVKGKQ